MTGHIIYGEEHDEKSNEYLMGTRFASNENKGKRTVAHTQGVTLPNGWTRRPYYNIHLVRYSIYGVSAASGQLDLQEQ
jgi:hypothetical protein